MTELMYHCHYAAALGALDQALSAPQRGARTDQNSGRHLADLPGLLGNAPSPEINPHVVAHIERRGDSFGLNRHHTCELGHKPFRNSIHQLQPPLRSPLEVEHTVSILRQKCSSPLFFARRPGCLTFSNERLARRRANGRPLLRWTLRGRPSLAAAKCFQLVLCGSGAFPWANQKRAECARLADLKNICSLTLGLALMGAPPLLCGQIMRRKFFPNALAFRSATPIRSCAASAASPQKYCSFSTTKFSAEYRACTAGHPCKTLPCPRRDLRLRAAAARKCAREFLVGA